MKKRFYSVSSASNEPGLRVRPGETFTVETEFCSGDWSGAEWDWKLSNATNPAVCVYVEGARRGTCLRVEIGEIDTCDVGFTAAKEAGALRRPDWPDVKKTVRIEKGRVVWDGGFSIPARPMLGVVGVAPASGEAFLNSRNGPYGGNLDAQELTTGATAILPVFVEGALLHVGDMHALQGDGEICGWGGIETRGRVTMTVELAGKPRSMTMPRFEDATHIGAFGCARPAESAFRQATLELISWMVEGYGFAREEALMLLGSVMEARCTQFVNPTFTYVSKVRKEYVEWKSSR